MASDFFVWDGRSNNTIGPYTEGNATELVKQLNQLDFDRSPMSILGKPSKIVGPFYVKTETERNRLRALGLTKGICK